MTNPASERIMKMIAEINANGFSRAMPFAIRNVEKRMKRHALLRSIPLASGKIYISAEGIAHALRDSKKSKGLSVSEKDFVDFPQKIRKMDLYYDYKVKTYIYTDGKNKFIVNPCKKLKINRIKNRVVFVTAQKVGEKEIFNGIRFEKIG